MRRYFPGCILVLLAGIITDTHFVKRDRLGRLLVFMARILQDGQATKVRAIALDGGVVTSSQTGGSAY